VQARHLAFEAVVLAALEEAARGDVATEPRAPAVDGQVGRPIQKHALCVPIAMLQQQADTLVEVLLVQGEGARVLCGVKEHRALLDERRLEHVRGAHRQPVRLAPRVALGCHELRADVSPIIGSVCRNDTGSAWAVAGA